LISAGSQVRVLSGPLSATLHRLDAIFRKTIDFRPDLADPKTFARSGRFRPQWREEFFDICIQGRKYNFKYKIMKLSL